MSGVVRFVKSLLTRVDRFQRRHRVPSLTFAVFKKFGDDRGGRLASLVAYYAFFSLFPLLLLMVTIFSYVVHGHPGVRKHIVDSALAHIPVIGQQIQLNTLQGNVVALIVGSAGALWAGLGALQAMETAMNEIWDVPLKHQPNFLVSRLRALAMLMVFGGGIIATAAVGAVVTYSNASGVVAAIVSGVLSLAVATGLYLVSFRILPNNTIPWRALLPGAVCAGIAFVVLQFLGGYYVTRVVNGASQTYGVFAVVIGLLSWLHLQAQISLLAAEINVVRHENLWPRSLTGDDLTEADERALCRYAKVEERRPDEDVSMDLADDGAAAPSRTPSAGRARRPQTADTGAGRDRR